MSDTVLQALRLIGEASSLGDEKLKLVVDPTIWPELSIVLESSGFEYTFDSASGRVTALKRAQALTFLRALIVA